MTFDVAPRQQSPPLHLVERPFIVAQLSKDGIGSRPHTGPTQVRYTVNDARYHTPPTIPYRKKDIALCGALWGW